MECQLDGPLSCLMTSRQQRESAQLTLSREVGYVRKPHANRLRVALAFPNTYFVGMSNLGFQTVYRLFNDHPDVVCERVFLPPKQELASLLQSGARLVTLESQTPVKEFDVFAFSVSFEWDYTNVLTMLRLADLPLRAVGPRLPDAARSDRWGRDLRQPRAAGAVRRRDCGGRRRNPWCRRWWRPAGRPREARRCAAWRRSAGSTSRRSTT